MSLALTSSRARSSSRRGRRSTPVPRSRVSEKGCRVGCAVSQHACASRIREEGSPDRPSHPDAMHGIRRRGEAEHIFDSGQILRILVAVAPILVGHLPLLVGILFGNDGKKIAIATDMGTYSEYTVENLKGMDSLLIEANHDVRMLQVGPYPYPLKQRILSDSGHLSNELSGRLISSILNDNIDNIFLGHLSKENNLPELAYETVRVEIDMSDNKYRSNDFKIMVAKRDQMSQVVNL